MFIRLPRLSRSSPERCPSASQYLSHSRDRECQLHATIRTAATKSGPKSHRITFPSDSVGLSIGLSADPWLQCSPRRLTYCPEARSSVWTAGRAECAGYGRITGGSDEITDTQSMSETTNHS